jgi:hypothetical protein
MKRCHQCGYTIHAQVKTCPYCKTAQADARGGSGTLLLVIGGVVALVAAANSITGGRTVKPPASPTAEGANSSTGDSSDGLISSSDTSSSKYSDVAKQYAWIETGKEQIKTKLKDPDSATFRNVHFYSGGGVPVTCGEVNAKNSFGGYNGFERFIAAGSQLAVLESDMKSPSELDEVWARFCSKAVSDEA